MGWLGRIAGVVALAGLFGSGLPGAARAYPLDGYAETGIARLEAYRLAQDGEIPGLVLYWGAQLYDKELKLHMLDHKDYTLPKPDPHFTDEVRKLLGADARDYGVAILDLSDPDAPLYAAWQPTKLQNPGSVGKIMVALGWFQALADLYPHDVKARQRLLHDTKVSADEFIVRDTHTVPFWSPGDPEYVRRPIALGDTANLYTWFDWMLSSSSNAAAAELEKELILLAHFGKAYPPSPKAAHAFLDGTPKAQLSSIFLETMKRGVTGSGLDPSQLRQGSFFTRTGKSRVPGVSSYASARELLRVMLLAEQGKLVDEWSSLKIKKLLYLTDKRIRYASTPVLWDYAVYFKSGSWYGCKPEKGFHCEKYMGNVRNFMNSVTMVESVDQKQKLDYISVVLSNVLRKNSSAAHRLLATQVQQLIQARHPLKDGEAKPQPSAEDILKGHPPEKDDTPDDSEMEEPGQPPDGPAGPAGAKGSP